MKKIPCLIIIAFSSIVSFAQAKEDGSFESAKDSAKAATEKAAAIANYQGLLVGKWNENNMPAYQWEYKADGKATEKNGNDAPKKYFYNLQYPEGFDKICIVAKQHAEDTRAIIFQIESLDENKLVLLVKLSQGLKQLEFSKKR